MPHIHYKFSSKLSYDTVVFDGPHITLEELKRLIMGREKLRAADCDLQITNAQSKEEFTDDNSLIQKDSSVIVRRIPISGVKPSPSSKTHNIEQSDGQHHHAFGASRAMDDQSSTGALTFFSKMQMANLVDADVSEEDKIKFMIYQSAYDSMGGNTRLGTALPTNYTCYRCGNSGHHIRNCPTSGQDKNFEAPLRIKKSTGIPRSFMVEVHDPTVKGALLTKCGRYAIPAVDAAAYAIGKKEKPPFIPQEQSKSEDEEESIPEELLCLICGDLLCDSVVIPCCGNSYCDDCIRTTLLDSEDHVCPSCGQSDVSPDTLVANKFLRQAINTFKREQSSTKTLKRKSDASQTKNSTPTPKPVATPPPAATQNQLQKPQHPPNSQQDSLLEHPKATNSPPSSQASGPPPALTGPESAHSTPISSLQPVQNSLETSDKESEGNTLDDSATASSVLVSNKDPTDAPSEPTPPVNHTVVAERPQTVSVNQQPSSADRASRLSGSSNSWDSSSSSSGYPSSLLSSPYPATPPPPLFPSPLFHTFLLAHQSHGSYPPGYPPATPVWTLPTPQGAPIPPLCSPASTSSIPALIPKEWYRYQRKKKERSPHRGSGYRRPSSHSNSRSSTSKSSRSYSRSSSRSGSRSRSRSHSKSRPHSPYSRQRDCRNRSPPSCSYTFGYKRSRSPTPSSSSSPQVGYHSRSKSPSDSWKSRHHSKKSASSSYSSRRRGECSERESGGSRSSLTRNRYGQHTNQSSSQDLDIENYMQWNYKEWYEKYFSYVGQFPQMPVPFVNILPPPCHQLEDREESRNHSHANLDSRYRPQGKHTARVDTRSPVSESSSDSRSPPSQSSSDSLSTPSYSSSGSRSSLSHKATDRRSPPSHSSSDGRSTPSEDGARSCTGKHKSPTVTPTRNSGEVDMQDRSTDDKQPILKNVEHFSTQKHEHKRTKKVDKGRGEDSSSLDSTDDSRKGQSRMSSGSSSCNTPEKNKATDKDASKSPLLKLNKSSDKDYERKVKKEKNLETEKGSRRGKDSESRHKEEIQPRKREPDRVNTDREKPSGGCRAPDSRSEKNRKRKVENLERNEKESRLSFKPESRKCLKTEAAENLETYKSESLKPLDREEKKKEKKIWPLMEGDIWEGGMEVKPQRKISININLGGKRQEEKSDKKDPSYSESITGKSQENIEHTAIREEMLNKDKIETDVNEKKESSRDQEILSEAKIKSEEEDRRKMWDKAALVLEKTADKKEDSREEKDKIEEEDFDLWHCALSGVEDSVEGKEEEAEKVTDECREEEMGGLAITPLKEKTEKESIYRETRGEADYTVRFNSQRSQRKSHHDGSTSTPDDGSSASVVGSCGWSEDREERWMVVSTLEESPEDRAADVFIQVPRSKRGNEGKKEQDEGEIRVHTVTLPQPSVTIKETGRDKEEQRRWSVERGRDGGMVRGRDREKKENATSSWSHRSVAPSSGKNTTDSTSCSERERHRDRERERERSNKSKRSKEETKKEERRRDGERERDRSSSASKQRRNPPSSSHSISVSQHKEKRDHRRESNQGSDGGKSSTVRSSTTSRATDLPDHSAHRPHRDVEAKSEDHFHCGSYQERSGNSRHQDRSAGTHPSPPPSSLSHSKETDLLLFESSAGPKRRSPNWGAMQNKSRNDSEVEEGEWKQNTVDKSAKKGKGEREKQEMVAGGSWWEDEDDKREEEERPSSQSSSSSSSTSQRSKDDQTNERKKERKYEKEKRQEVMEEGDLMQEKKRGGRH